MIKKFLLTFYPKDNTIEMYDLKNKRMFLKRMESQGLSVNDLYIGSIVTVYYRQLKIVDYGDVFTRSKFNFSQEKTFAMIKPDIYTQTGKVIDAIYANGFNITKLKMARFDQQCAQEFYAEHQGKPFYNDITSFLSSDVCTGIEMVGDNAISKWRQIIGPAKCSDAKMNAPRSLRAAFGTDDVKNGVHGSDSK